MENSVDPVLTVIPTRRSTNTFDDSDVVAALTRLSEPDVDSSERNSLEELITRHYLPMARRVASRFAGSGADIEDLTQVACLALVKAIRRFDHERGGFWQYAQVTISGELKRHLRDHAWAIRPPRRVQDLHTQIGKATER